MEFERLCNVSSLEIQWWGISFAKNYKILAAGEDEVYHEVKTEQDASENPQSRSDYNEWSKLTGWSLPTKKLKLLLSDGHLDPWGKNVWIGTRQVNVIGKPITKESDFSPNTFLKHRIKRNFLDHPSIGRDLLLQLEEILSQNCTIVASVQEDVQNLTDGTGSEWYCKDQEGVI